LGRSQRIYVDLDDVVCQTIELLVDLLAAEFGRRVAVAEVTCFDLSASFGLGPEELERFMDRAHDPEVLQRYQLRSGALEGLAGWRGQGREIWIVTGRPASAAPGTRRWLERVGVPFDELLFVQKYSGRTYDPGDDGATVAVEELGSLGFDLAVEDSAEMAVRLRDELQVPVLLLDRPWNRDLPDEPGRLRRCADWAEVLARAPSPPGR